jgi:hypothetical protein
MNTQTQTTQNADSTKHAFLVLWARADNGRLTSSVIAESYKLATKIAAGHSLSKSETDSMKKMAKILFAHEIAARTFS